MLIEGSYLTLTTLSHAGSYLFGRVDNSRALNFSANNRSSPGRHGSPMHTMATGQPSYFNGGAR